MKFIITFLLCFVLKQGFSQNTNYLKANAQTILLADPTVFENEGTYYLYGTNNDPSIKEQGFLVYTSKDLREWKGPVGAKDGFALKKGDSFGTKGFWAPQVFKYKGIFYMAYTADEQIAIATAKSPLGPFLNSSAKALEAPVKQIDPFIFIDEEGKKYLYHVRLQDGNRIFVAEMNDDFKSIKTETLQEIISGEEEWENTQNVEWLMN
ncbi:family 43 glycosylhydrolase [Antarcticibacterium sp. 1MA-6-2]|uniref:family 43 glycosylhydrolase n=1 Tax=Antarcticibacterium sp. 1MA-6-2 TaxID=2908210 RepID=UPI002882E0F7|nr:family 43 glycosylhydrolase [Antarcticibacterium sp. 1MA-6-2]